MAADGTRRFRALMAAIPAAVKKGIDATLVQQAGELVDLARRAVPVRKGALRASIRAERTPGRELSISVKAGGAQTTKPVREGQAATYDYALGQEFGNERAPAQPFFFPSYRLRKPAIRRATTKAVKKAVTESAK
ncbi:HK97 gp10 family phage protein [uncultured Enterovirga sp.]|uniref:HK97 gp10 family phage protein n=1 Tax=uncultured Enterovirga sp. TaxID=2026352 RepID=UPI0035CBD463